MKLTVMLAAAESDKRRLQVVPSATCRPGCSGCCSRWMEVTVAEASLMVLWLKERGLWPEVRAEAERQAPLARATPPDAWFKMNEKCPVLDRASGRCRAHPVRPPACSTHFSSSDPSACDPWSSSAARFSPVDFTDLYLEAQRKIRDELSSDGVLLISLPMPIALLMADRVSVRAGLSYEEAVAMIGNEL